MAGHPHAQIQLFDPDQPAGDGAGALAVGFVLRAVSTIYLDVAKTIEATA